MVKNVCIRGDMVTEITVSYACVSDDSVMGGVNSLNPPITHSFLILYHSFLRITYPLNMKITCIIIPACLLFNTLYSTPTIVYDGEFTWLL